MLPAIPLSLNLLFLASVAFTFLCMYLASGKSRLTAVLLLAWLVLQSAVSLSGFYQNTQSLPPRFLLLVVPGVVATVFFLVSPKGRQLLARLNSWWLLALHVVRVPVELVLYGLYREKLVPVQMTFEGWNFDVFSGLSALVVLLAYQYGRAGKKVLLVWNLVCLLLLLNIVVTAVLAAPTPFQKLAFDQPNLAVFYFPFTLLPGFVVPLVLFSHVAMLFRLSTEKLQQPG